MKRRGFLGLLGGAAVAGPSMAKQAVASIGDLSLGQLSGGVGSALGTAQGMSISDMPGDGGDWNVMRLAQIAGRTAAEHSAEMAKVHVHQFDPDIAEYRAIRLGSKIRMQRERDYWRQLENKKSWLEQLVNGAVKSLF